MEKIIIFLLLPLLFISCEDEKTVFIADHYTPNQELLFRENKTEKWTPFSDVIEGFTYEEGYEYKLKVKIANSDDKVTYTLLKIESKVKTSFLEEMETVKQSLDKNWKVTDIIGFVNKTKITPRFTVKNGRVEGTTGCNDFGGEVSLDTNGRFKTGRINSTKKYCKETMPIEDAFLPALFKASKYKFENGVLHIMDKANTLLFTAEETKNESELFGNWIVKEIVGFNNTTHKNPSILFKKGKIQGDTGCNNYGGTFVTDSNNLFKTERIMVTKKYCQDYMELERYFMSALSKASTYEINANTLKVYNNNNELLFFAERKEDTLEKALPKTTIEYNTYSPTLAIRNKLTENQLVYYDLRPKPTEPRKVILTKEDLQLCEKEIAKLDLKELAKLKPPSEKFKNGGVGATLIVTKNGKLVRVPTFDHNNPPIILRPLIHKIMEIRNR